MDVLEYVPGYERVSTIFNEILSVRSCLRGERIYHTKYFDRLVTFLTQAIYIYIYNIFVRFLRNDFNACSRSRACRKEIKMRISNLTKASLG